VVWIFTKDEQRLRCEIAHADGSGYRIVVTHPDRTEMTEDIEQPSTLAERTVAVMKDLHDAGWHIA
jgi:hypothetical protein